MDRHMQCECRVHCNYTDKSFDTVSHLFQGAHSTNARNACLAEVEFGLEGIRVDGEGIGQTCTAVLFVHALLCQHA